ncbi:MAG TPA: response regulator [Anaerolineales bacterium]|nr:response regulator [Anaerolineales bacterium]
MSPEPLPRILIVDDNEQLASVMQTALKRAGFEAHTAFSGDQALAWLSQNKPDVIILDLMMPGMNGFSLLRQLRASEPSRTLPVIVLTARSDLESRRQSESAGASDFLTKPVRSPELVEHVRRALASRADGAHAHRV